MAFRLKRAFQRRERVIRHAGTMVHNGHIVLTTGGGAKAKNYDCGRFGSVPLEVIQSRMEDIQGQTFIRLVPPSQLVNYLPPEMQKDIAAAWPEYAELTKALDGDDQRIVGMTEGFNVTAEIAEMVYNDWVLIDQIHGKGAYESVLNHHERAVLNLVKHLRFQTATVNA